MANIGTIAYQLSVNPFGLTKGLETASRSLTAFAAGIPKGLQRQTNAVTGLVLKPIEGFLGGVRGLLTSLPFIGAAFAAIPITGAGFTEFVKAGMDRVSGLARLSDSTGISTRRIGGLMLQTGGDAESLEKSLFRLNNKLGDVAQGNKTTARTFAGLGLDGVALAAMPADRALGVIADRIHALPTSAEKAHATFELFGKGAKSASLIPILSKGSKAMEEAQAQAAKLGLGFSRVDAAQVQLAQKSLQQASLAVQGLQTQLAVQLAPYIKAAADWFNKMALSGVNMAELVATGIEKVVSVIAQIADIVNVVRLGWNALQSVIDGVIAGIVSGLGTLFEAAGKLDGVLGTSFAKTGEDLKAMGKNLFQDAKRDADQVKAEWNKPWAGDNVKKFFAEIKAGAAKAGQAAVDSMKGSGEGLAASEKLAALLEKGDALTKELASPFEKFNTALDDYNELVKAGAISWDTYSKAIGKATDELAKATKIGETKSPEALQAGSKEAYSAINRFRNESQGSPQEQMVGLLREALTVQRLQLEANRRTNNALSTITVADL